MIDSKVTSLVAMLFVIAALVATGMAEAAWSGALLGAGLVFGVLSLRDNA